MAAAAVEAHPMVVVEEQEVLEMAAHCYRAAFFLLRSEQVAAEETLDTVEETHLSLPFRRWVVEEARSPITKP